MVDAGLITITAFISPYREDRDNVRAMLDDDEFIEIYTQCSVEECERRILKDFIRKLEQVKSQNLLELVHLTKNHVILKSQLILNN